MPIDYSKYPANWKSEIVPRILSRANNQCEFCFIRNNSTIYCIKVFIRVNGKYGWRSVWFYNFEDAKRLGRNIGALAKQLKVVLTVAHLDHDETNINVDDSRLKALCQYCHLNYDSKEKMRRIMEGGKK